MAFSCPVGFPSLIVRPFLIVDPSLLVGLFLFVGPSLPVSSPLFVGPSLLVRSFLIFRSALIGVTPRISGCTCRALRPWWSWRLARRLASADKEHHRERTHN